MANTKIRAKKKGASVEVKVLVRHPMETGLRKDSKGNAIPAHYIETFEASSGGKKVFAANLGPAVSKDPVITFRYNGEKGDTVSISWKDNKGEGETAERQVK